MKLSAKLAFQHLKNNPKRTAWTLFSIVLASGMLVAIGGSGVSGAAGLEALIDTIDGIDSGTAEIVSLSLATALGVVVAFVSAVVISNTFRVSAMERAKQFGILKSVGATKKQIRATVMYEGLFLLMIGLPLGIIAGFGMHLLALVAINQMVDISAISDTVWFRFEIEPVILLIAIILSTLAVLFSAWLPARKVAKTPAIDAIKGTNDISQHREKSKNARFIGKIFGFEGVLAAKQLKRSRRHFRATVISISTSLVLILASVSLSTHMSRSFEGRILQIGAPTAVLGLSPPPGTSTIGLDAETFTQITRAMREFPDTFIAANSGRFYNSTEHGVTMAVVPTIDDYMELLNLAGATYGSNLLINVHIEVDASGNLVQYNPFAFESGEVFRLYRHESTVDGFVWADEADYITIHGIVNELPSHLMQLSESILILIVPDGDIQAVQWGANTLDPDGFKEFAKAILHSYYTLGVGEELIVADLAEAIQLLRIMIDSALAYVRIFSIMLIFLGLTNVISTIATNVKLRGREFAVLASIGMERRGLRRMLAFESLLSSARALTFGLPIGFGMAYLMYIIGMASNPIGIVFTPPWIAMAVCAAGVVVITFVIMQISAMAVKRSNLIETIRG